MDRQKTPPPTSPFAVAKLWFSRALTVSLEMVVPGTIGVWIDKQLGWWPWLSILGFAGGLVLGMWHLLVMTRPPDSRD
ncbi:AtpZ/AtpI family protein [Aeoliella sp. ICT_H6.2]|uniref:AtpZ/AtpI family protein n=1 Tax=Aeoliella straminimaris TaxID=2954799 RepID=A0A9X2JJG5_9BACT|nr:AtpZ/AtpI family protein [Aeoliella straminimaris]MCO6048145.1 AtpZ/AtpI family protein [Aeoliella straminimaris]